MDDLEQTIALQVHVPAAHVLVVEDNLVSQRVVSAMLAKLGHVVEVASDGREALERVRQRRPDLVLMDCQMPEMDGYQATREIRSRTRWRQLTIIAMTANAMERDRDQALASGMNDHIAKPINVSEMFATLARWVMRESPRA